MGKFMSYFDKALCIWSRCLMAAMTLGVITLVFSRYVLGVSYIWAEESISVLFLATTYFGAALGVRYNEHIRIEYFTDMMSPRVKKIVTVVQILVVIALQLVLLKVCLHWIGKVGGTLTPGRRVPTRYIYVMFPINVVIVTFYELLRLVSLLRGQEIEQECCTDSGTYF